MNSKTGQTVVEIIVLAENPGTSTEKQSIKELSNIKYSLFLGSPHPPPFQLHDDNMIQHILKKLLYFKQNDVLWLVDGGWGDGFN